MATIRVRQTNAGTGNGAGGARNSATTWTLTLSGTPSVGNTLLLYIGSVNALSISSIVQGGSNSNWTSIYTSTNTNTNIYVFALYVTSGSNTTVTLTLNSASNQFYSICEEISGLSTSNWLDKSTNTTSASTNSPTTGTTAVTNNANEYWVNLYCYFSNGAGDTQGSSPTNGYSLYNTGTPIRFTDTGWTAAGGNILALVEAGMVMTYQIVSTTGNAGGSISDSLNNSNSYNSVALSFFSTGGGLVVNARRRISSSFM
jgi:hypothetical protein